MIPLEWWSGCKRYRHPEVLYGTVGLSLFSTQGRRLNEAQRRRRLQLRAAQAILASDDSLPPFATLTSDEDREKKAESRTPGTFHVVVNPESFSHLPEYSEDTIIEANFPAFSRRRASLALSLASSKDIERALDRSPSIAGSDDPNVVILSRFEDNKQRPNPHPKAPQPESSPVLSGAQFQLNVDGVDGVDGLNLRDDQDPSQALVTIAAQGGQDAGLLDHFRNRVWRQIVQIDCDQMNSPVSKMIAPGADIFGQEAVFFPPVNSTKAVYSVRGLRWADSWMQLFHAMMAVSALSLAHQDGVQRLDAFQHYQQAVPSLQSNLRRVQDLSSDGAFLTVFLLLIYEVCCFALSLEHCH